VNSSGRDDLRRSFSYACGYCGVTEAQVGAELTVDHFQPKARGGGDERTNLVYSCHACNEFKGDYWNPGSEERILHPACDVIADHLCEQDDGTLVGLTPTGTFHIERLRLNRGPLVEHRCARRRLEAAREAQARLVERLVAMHALVESLLAELEREPHP
jgi:hypothetical protein